MTFTHELEIRKVDAQYFENTGSFDLVIRLPDDEENSVGDQLRISEEDLTGEDREFLRERLSDEVDGVDE